ncbi:hypothetical protein LXL04_025552 [Taraxacum kok-saghyz]
MSKLVSGVHVVRWWWSSSIVVLIFLWFNGGIAKDAKLTGIGLIGKGYTVHIKSDILNEDITATKLAKEGVNGGGGGSNSQNYDAQLRAFNASIYSHELLQNKYASRPFKIPMVVKSNSALISPPLQDDIKSFKEMVAACLVKDPKNCPSSEKLLKHPLFKHAKTCDYLERTILDGLSPLGDRFMMLKLNDLNEISSVEDPKTTEQQNRVNGVTVTVTSPQEKVSPEIHNDNHSDAKTGRSTCINEVCGENGYLSRMISPTLRERELHSQVIRLQQRSSKKAACLSGENSSRDLTELSEHYETKLRNTIPEKTKLEGEKASAKREIKRLHI